MNKITLECSFIVFRCGNIDGTDDLHDLFDRAPSLTKEVIDDFRYQFNKLEEAYHVQQRYLRTTSDKKFLFNEELSYCFTGLKLHEIDFIYEKYLKEHDSCFRKFSSKEMLNALLLRF